MPDLTAIQTALYDLATGDAALMALISEVYDTLAEYEPTYPYMVITTIDAVDEWNYDASLDRIRIQVDIYDKNRSAATVHSCLNALDAAFNVVSVLDSTGVYLDGMIVPLMTRRIREDPDIWRISRDYMLVFERAARRA